MQITQEEKVVAVTKKEKPPRARGTSAPWVPTVALHLLSVPSALALGVGCCCSCCFVFKIMKNIKSLIFGALLYNFLYGLHERNSSLNWNLSLKCQRNLKQLFQKSFLNLNLEEKRSHQRKVNRFKKKKKEHPDIVTKLMKCVSLEKINNYILPGK